MAELWGAAVWGADSSEVNLSSEHPHFGGLLGHMFAKDSQPVTARADAVLICGTYVFPEVFPALAGAFAPQAKIVHIDLDTDAIAKNFPVDLGLVSDPKLTLAQLAEALEQGDVTAAAAGRPAALGKPGRRATPGAGGQAPR